jgi:hypothetical protein
MQQMNMRNYFDRPVGRPGERSVPRKALRPHWVLDVPKNVSKDGEVYRIFNARQARWEDQTHWAPMQLQDGQDLERGLNLVDQSGESDKKSTTKSQSLSRLSGKPRTPRKPEDLKLQRKLEQEWDKHHGCVYSRFNQHWAMNVRSYFDRWKDEGGGLNNNEVTWKLPYERKPLGGSRNAISQPDLFKDRGGLAGQPGWVGNF